MSEDVRLSRIIGTEMEYGIQFADGTVMNFIDQRAVEQAGIPRAFAFMGTAGSACKIGVDGGHLELGTGEALGPASAACQDIDGVGLMSRIVTASGYEHDGLYRLAGTYIYDGRILNTSETTSDGRTAGYHQNYQSERKTTNDEELMAGVFASAIASRLWALSGTVLKEGFAFGQKIPLCEGTPISRNHNRRTKKKPMVQIVDHWSDADLLGSAEQSRVEVRCGDPGHSLVARYLDFAANSLMLRLTENEHIVGRERMLKWALKDPIKAMQIFAADLSLTAIAETQDGKKVTALDLQNEQLEWFETLAASSELVLPLDEREAIPLIRETNDALHASNPAEAEYTPVALTRIDFAKRHQHISRGLPQERVNARNELAMTRNLLWDRVLPVGKGQVYWRYVAEHDPVALRVREHNARLGLAGRAILRASHLDMPKRVQAVSWLNITVDRQLHTMSDPYLYEFAQRAS